MTTIIQKPDFYSFLGNLKKVILNTSVKIIVKLSKADSDILAMEYEPSPDGSVTIDLKNIIAANMPFDLPAAEQYIVAQMQYFTLKVDEIPMCSFYVLPGGIAGSATAETFLPYNFLTWQPQSKKTAWNTPNWLRYANIHDDCIAKIKAYFEDKTTQTIDLLKLQKNKVYTFNLQVSSLAAKFKKQPLYIDVWVQQQETVISFTQRYVLTNTPQEHPDYFVFENTLGGIDTILFDGEKSLIPEVEAKQALFDQQSIEYHIDFKKIYKKETGYFSNRLLQTWVEEFFRSLNRFHFVTTEDATLRRIVVSDTQLETNPDVANSHSFKFAYSIQDQYFNLPRTQELPEELVVVVPGDPVFSLAPRLSELPLADVGADPIIPVQHPFEQTWRKLPLSTILESIRKVTLIGEDKFYYTNTFPPTISPETIKLIAVEHNFSSTPENRRWEYLQNEKWVQITGQHTYALTIAPDDELWKNATSLTIRYLANDRYSDMITISKVRDGSDAFNVVLLSTKGTLFPNGIIKTDVYAIVYRGSENITQSLKSQNFVWTRQSDDIQADQLWNDRKVIGQKIAITEEDVPEKATFMCEIII